MIEVVTIVITPIGVTITAIGPDGATKVVHARGKSGLLVCIQDDNFEEVPAINQNEDLLEALVNITEPALDLCHTLEYDNK